MKFLILTAILSLYFNIHVVRGKRDLEIIFIDFKALIPDAVAFKPPPLDFTDGLPDKSPDPRKITKTSNSIDIPLLTSSPDIDLAAIFSAEAAEILTSNSSSDKFLIVNSIHHLERNLKNDLSNFLSSRKFSKQLEIPYNAFPESDTVFFSTPLLSSFYIKSSFSNADEIVANIFLTLNNKQHEYSPMKSKILQHIKSKKGSTKIYLRDLIPKLQSVYFDWSKKKITDSVTPNRFYFSEYDFSNVAFITTVPIKSSKKYDQEILDEFIPLFDAYFSYSSFHMVIAIGRSGLLFNTLTLDYEMEKFENYLKHEMPRSSIPTTSFKHQKIFITDFNEKLNTIFLSPVKFNELNNTEVLDCLKSFITNYHIVVPSFTADKTKFKEFVAMHADEIIKGLDKKLKMEDFFEKFFKELFSKERIEKFINSLSTTTKPTKPTPDTGTNVNTGGAGGAGGTGTNVNPSNSPGTATNAGADSKGVTGTDVNTGNTGDSTKTAGSGTNKSTSSVTNSSTKTFPKQKPKNSSVSKGKQSNTKSQSDSANNTQPIQAKDIQNNTGTTANLKPSCSKAFWIVFSILLIVAILVLTGSIYLKRKSIIELPIVQENNPSTLIY